MKRNISVPLTLIAVGVAIATVGEVMGATDEHEGGTLSEQYGNAPEPLKHFISFCLGALCAHLWKWVYGAQPQPDVTFRNVEGDVNITEEKNAN